MPDNDTDLTGATGAEEDREEKIRRLNDALGGGKAHLREGPVANPAALAATADDDFPNLLAPFPDMDCQPRTAIIALLIPARTWLQAAKPLVREGGNG